MIECSCAQCGATFKRYPCETERKYCSRPCFRLGRRATVEMPCRTCGRLYRPRPGREGGFCSRACVRWVPGKQPGHGRPKGRQVVRACKWCGAAFSDYPSSDRAYCTPACRELRKAFTKACGGVHYVRIRYFNCEGCQRLAVASGWQPKRRFCGTQCARSSKPSRLLSASCVVCSQPFEFYSGRSAARFCSRECMGLAARVGREVRSCEVCGEAFEFRPSKAQPGRFCSHACRDASMRLSDEHKTEVRRMGARKRRASLAGVQSEPYKAAEIADRDKWRCQLCGKSVPKKAVWPDPRSASIDHIIPISDGGSDIKANVQLAHLRCNLSKHTRTLPQGEQLRLIG